MTNWAYVGQHYVIGFFLKRAELHIGESIMLVLLYIILWSVSKKNLSLHPCNHCLITMKCPDLLSENFLIIFPREKGRKNFFILCGICNWMLLYRLLGKN